MTKGNVRTRKRTRWYTGKQSCSFDSVQPAVTMDIDQTVKYVARPLFVISLAVLFLLCFGAITAVWIAVAVPYDLDQESPVSNVPSPTESLELQELQTYANGWRVADHHEREELDTTRCNIDRRDANSLTSEEFESRYRFKKPVLLTFSNGAAEWTDPDLFQRRKLLDLYAYWSISSGKSLDIVKSGGSGKIEASFGEYVEEMMNERDEISDEPFYVFDRDFFQGSELQRSLHPPHMLTSGDGTDDSFFFMGASRSGVSFHKHADAWNAVVVGRKRWFLYPPSQTPPGGVWPGYSQIDWLEKVYPTLEEDNKPLECVQEAGEILYLPESYYHGTINIGDTLAIGLQKKDARTPVESLFYVLRLLEVKSKQTNDKNEKTLLQGQIVEKYYQLYKLLPKSAEICHKLGEALYNDGQYDKALEFTQRAIDYDPNFVIAYSSLARYLKEHNDTTSSETAIRRAYNLNPHNFDIIIQYAELAEASSDLQTAANLYEEGIHLNPEDHLLYFRLSYVLKSLGKDEQAVQVYRKAQFLEEEQLSLHNQYEM